MLLPPKKGLFRLERGLLLFKAKSVAAVEAAKGGAMELKFTFPGAETPPSNPKPGSATQYPGTQPSNSDGPPPPVCNSCFRDGSSTSPINHRKNERSFPGDTSDDSDNMFSHSSIPYPPPPPPHFSPPPPPALLISKGSGTGCSSGAHASFLPPSVPAAAAPAELSSWEVGHWWRGLPETAATPAVSVEPLLPPNEVDSIDVEV